MSRAPTLVPAAVLAVLVLLSTPGCQTGLFGGDGDEPRSDMPGVRFIGNEAVERGDLEDAAIRELRSFREKGGNRADAADAAYAMEILLRERGFHESRVEFEVTGAQATFTAVSYTHLTLPTTDVGGCWGGGAGEC